MHHHVFPQGTSTGDGRLQVAFQRNCVDCVVGPKLLLQVSARCKQQKIIVLLSKNPIFSASKIILLKNIVLNSCLLGAETQPPSLNLTNTFKEILPFLKLRLKSPEAFPVKSLKRNTSYNSSVATNHTTPRKSHVLDQQFSRATSAFRSNLWRKHILILLSPSPYFLI